MNTSNDENDKTEVIPRMFKDEPPASSEPSPEDTAVLPMIFDEPAPPPGDLPEPTARIPVFFEDPPEVTAVIPQTFTGPPVALDDAIIHSVLDTHLDEAEYLFDLREACLDAPEWTLDELEEGPEARLQAHLDGLLLGGPQVATQLLEPTLAAPSQPPSRITIAALARLAGDDGGVGIVLQAIDAGDDPAHQQALALALGRSERPGLARALLDSLATAPLHGIAARLTALAHHRVALGPKLLDHLRSSDLPTLRAAASLARFGIDGNILGALAPFAQSEDPQLRALTLDAALHQQVPAAWPGVLYWAFVAPDPALRRWALLRVALLGDAGAHQRLLDLLADPAARADTLWALGFCGRPAAVDAAIPWLADDELGPLAGEVVCAIAGLLREGDEFWRERPAASESEALPELADDDLDAELEPPPEQALPLPNPEAIAAWWAARREAFDRAQRYLDGQPLHQAGMVAALRMAPLRRRHALALELSLRSGARAYVDTRAWASVQRRQLAEVEAMVDLRASLPG